MRNNYSSSLERIALVSILAIGLPGALQAQSPSRVSQPPPGALIVPLANDQALGFHIAGDTGTPAAGSDAELCSWALDDWVGRAEGQIAAVSVGEDDALIRIYFVSPGAGRYGEMRPILVDGKRGAEVYVRTETDSLGPEIAAAARRDPLFRDTIVYLTCLHEIGHALGMVHTDVFDDVMYFFGFGGDILEFFGRYRDRLAARTDIPQESGLSSGDVRQLREAYPAD